MKIEANELSKIYGEGESRVTALDRASFQIMPGDFISITGPSGSGKSTLLHLLSGLDQPTSGRLTYDGQDIYSLSDRERSALRRRSIGFVFQQFHLLPVLTARENILMPLLLDKKQPAEAYLEQLTQLLGIGSRLTHLPPELSGGQQQRVAIARALSAKPAIILADEPVAALDPVTAKQVMQDFVRINREMGISILLNIHHIELAMEYADRIIGIRSGKIVYDGPAKEVDQAVLDAIYGEERGQEART